jgi:hypothetical protein
VEQAELLKKLVLSLEDLSVPYLLTGSLATSAFGEPRFTHDIDVVVRLTLAQVPQLCAAFPAPDYYCELTAAKEAVRQRFQFNILHPASGQKVDVIVATDSEFDCTRLARGVRVPAGPDFEATFSAPEDVIIKKLEYFREGGSEKHLRDIVGVLHVQGQGIDQAYLRHWVARLGLHAEWALVEERLGGSP